MAVLYPLSCIRPKIDLAAQIATGPHSAMSKEEIHRKVLDNPITYSRIVHPRALYGDVPDAYARAAAMLNGWLAEGIMSEDGESAYYLYRLEVDGHSQTGLVGRTPIDEILDGHIHAHETIRKSKLVDLAAHIEECDVQIGGPILMACRSCPEMLTFARQVRERKPLYDFVSENGVHNQIWKLKDAAEQEWIEKTVATVGDLYIADGHHRVMAAVEICRRQRSLHPDYTGREPWNYLACVCFGDSELQILPYARAVTGLNGRTEQEFVEALRENFSVEERQEPVIPRKKGEFGLLLQGRWRALSLREERRPEKPQENLDVSVLQSLVLEPLLGICDPRSDGRLEFVGGKDQLEALIRKCRRPDTAGFTFYPTSMEELFAVADAEGTMPPKSTWFEPKLCNGLFLYRLQLRRSDE